MIGWFSDVVVGFVISAVVRFIKIRSSEAWPVEKGTISGATCPLQYMEDQSQSWGIRTSTRGNTTLAYIVQGIGSVAMRQM